MPLAVEGLNPNSTDEEIQAAVSASIEQCVGEGKDAKQCAAIANRYVTELTGKGKMRAGFAAQGVTKPKPAGGMGLGIGGALPPGGLV